MSGPGHPQPESATGKVVFLAGCLAILLGAIWLASQVQGDFGRVEVTNVTFANYNGIPIRAKLFRPRTADVHHPVPGAVYIHGYQNNRETSDPYAIELARRGIAVLEIDAIGRGNSGLPGPPQDPDFDTTYGAKSSLMFLKSLPFVQPGAVAMMGHSLGGEMAYAVAMKDREVQALVISGFAYKPDATATNPKNMLMIMGQWDEYRQRMTGVRDIYRDWMQTPQTKKVFPVADPKIGLTYGDFAAGTARRVVVLPAIHMQISHSQTAVAEAVAWLKPALHPPAELWREPGDQLWPIKEWATLVALIAALAALLPLGHLLLGLTPLRSLSAQTSGKYACPNKDFWQHTGVNALLMWLYLPLIFILFGFHVYVVKIDRAFPMMMLNALAWWFLWINVIGFFVFRRWYRKMAAPAGVSLADLGLSWPGYDHTTPGQQLIKAIILAIILFFFAYGVEYFLEAVFIVDYRFIFPMASDLTLERWGMFFLYLPFFIMGYLQTGIFLHGQIRRPARSSRLATWLSWSASGTIALVAPLAVLLLVQYLPLLTTGFIPFVGPGGFLANFSMTLFHVIGLIVLTTPISTWFFILTGKIYPGAILNALLVTWMLTSSQVVAPIPV